MQVERLDRGFSVSRRLVFKGHVDRVGVSVGFLHGTEDSKLSVYGFPLTHVMFSSFILNSRLDFALKRKLGILNLLNLEFSVKMLYV